MSDGAHLLLVLHMHQPSYLDPQTDQYLLPWVRLHGVREYYDIANLLLAHPEASLTINLVPSLLTQLKDNSENPYKDRFFALSQADPRHLNEQDRRFVLTNFFLANWNHMIFPLPRYKELLQRRGLEITEVDWNRVPDSFSPQDILDLQVLFNLAWLGFSALDEFPAARQLREKGRNFTAADKKTVLDIHVRIMGQVIERYRQVAATGRVELSTTPAFHPILPLLMDSRMALRCDPSTPLPEPPFAYPDDAALQITRGRAIFTELLGREPRGMWPSEGSVCPELIPVAQQAGFEWMATDEEVLRTTLNNARREDIIYRPWRARRQGAEISMIFRDKHLSDLIGFTYSRNPAEAAADHFAGILENIARQDNNAQVTVVLDGENPWEHYEDGGRPFLSALFARLARSDLVHMKTVSQSLSERPPHHGVDHIHTASWINNNFRVWIGGQEENKAWQYLARVRAVLRDRVNKDSDRYRMAMGFMLAAEGSDWFWWYGDTFHTDTPELFDNLFRAHLAMVYDQLGLPRPDFLAVPVLSGKSGGPTITSTDYINPDLDGVVTSYYEWWGAGSVDLTGAGGGGAGGVMAQGASHLQKLFCGFDKENLYLRLDFSAGDENLKQRIRAGEVEVEFFFSLADRQGRLYIGVDESGAMDTVWASGNQADDLPDRIIPSAGRAALGRILEASVPLSRFDGFRGAPISLAMRLVTQSPTCMQFELARYPRHGYFVLQVPTDDFESKNWSAL